MKPLRQTGSTLIEVLVTIVILSVGLLGIAALQAKTQVGAIESYQRAQAIILVGDMAARIAGNPNAAASYISSTPIGTGDGRSDDCSGAAAGAPLDLCEWSKALRGSAEKTSNNTRLGAMDGGRGCIELIQAANAAAGVCRPAIYRVTVTWQGMHQTTAPSVTCASGSYGDDTYRRATTQQLTVALTSCS